MQRTITGWSRGGERKRWFPTTLDQLNKDEKFLGDTLAATPELMGIETRRSGIRGPLRVFQQLAMSTPSGRSIFPDIVFLATSGHVIVVEVKRSVNPELRDRAVIAQIIDYASSFASLSELQCVQLFGSAADQTWTDVITRLFPHDPTPDDLADVLLSRMKSGEINLVIACDRVPAGLPDVVAGILAQHTLGFDLDLVEVVPFVERIADDADILFVPTSRLSTEIVSRTAIAITYRTGDTQPTTSVQTTSVEEIERNVRVARQSANPDARIWTAAEVETEFRQKGNTTAAALLDFAKQHSDNGDFTIPGRRLNAILGFYVRSTRDDGVSARRVVFNCILGWSSIGVFFDAVDAIAVPTVAAELRKRLKTTFGRDIDIEQKQAGMTLDTLSRHLVEFLETMLWFKQELAVCRNR